MRRRAGGLAQDVVLGPIERLVALQSCPEWTGLGAPELALLASIAEPRALPEGARALEPGRPVGALLVVLEGELEVRGHEGAARRAGPGELVAALLAYAGDPLGCECVAARPSVVLRIALDDLEDVLEDRPSVLMHVVRRVALEARALGAKVPLGPREASSPEPPLDLVERILVLRRTRALGARSIDGVAALAGVARELHAARGAVLWRAGEPSASMLVVVSGTVLAPDEARSIGPGELAGDLDCLADQPRSHDAVAGSELVALVVERDELFDTWEDHVDLGLDHLRTLARAVLAAQRA